MMRLTIEKIRARLAADEGFTLIELLIVLMIMSILLLIAVPAYLGYEAKAESVAAQSNVSSAVPAAEAYYTGAGGSSYANISGAKLTAIAPGVSPQTKAVALNGGLGYCVEDTDGPYIFDYIGGTATPIAGSVGVIQSGSCLSNGGATAT